MRALVQQWETSGELRKEFASRHGLTLARFDYWKRRVRREASAVARVEFAPVRLVTDPTPSDRGVIQVVLATGERLTIGDGTSVDLLRAVVSVLRPSC